MMRVYFWILMFLWLIFGIWSAWPVAGAWNYSLLGGSLISFVLFAILGRKVFGSPFAD